MISFERRAARSRERGMRSTRKSGRGKARERGNRTSPIGWPSSSSSFSSRSRVTKSTIEELEATNEELKATNEELQSTNEELQTANEELETSKEEMQSLNEELQTVNTELQRKVEELSRANDDMKNLLNATEIATVFLDSALNITRYTEQAKRIMRLIPSDVGPSHRGPGAPPSLRPASARTLGRSLSTLVYKELDIQGEDRCWYFMRILPYRTTDNVIDGLVMTFTDITKIKALQSDQDDCWRR